MITGNIFRGTIEGKTARDISKDLNYDKHSLAKRKENVEERLKETSGFLEEYNSNEKYHKVNKSMNDNTDSVDNNVFHEIEKLANYLLGSDEIREKTESKKLKYILLDSKKFDEMLNKEAEGNLDINNAKIANSMVVQAPSTKAVYKSKTDYKITKADLQEDSECGQALREYQKVKDHLKREMVKSKNKEFGAMPLWKIKNNLGSINDDMIQTKIGLKKPIVALKLETSITPINLDNIDYTNEKHIESIIKTIDLNMELDPVNDISILALDIKRAIENLYKLNIISPLDRKITYEINEGATYVELAEEIGMSNNGVKKRFLKVVNLVAEYFRDADRYYELLKRHEEKHKLNK